MSPKPYKYNKKAGRYVSKTLKGNRTFYKNLLDEIIKTDFDQNSTYGKFIINQLIIKLKKYKNLKYLGYAEKYNFDKFLNTLESSNSYKINITKKEFNNKLSLIKEKFANKNYFIYRFINKYETIISFSIPLIVCAMVFYYNFNNAFITIFIFYPLLYAIVITLFEYLKRKIEGFYVDSEEQIILTKKVAKLKKQQVLENKKNIKEYKVQKKEEKKPLKDIISEIKLEYKKLKQDKWINFVLNSSFYSSTDWHKVRNNALKKFKNTCIICNSKHNLSVDHIKPRSKYPHLALELSNTQILCKSCNSKKGNKIKNTY